MLFALSKVRGPIIASGGLSVCWCCLVRCCISLQGKLIVLLSWFVWLLWILISLKCPLIGLDCCCLRWYVSAVAGTCFHCTINCWIDTFGFEGVCVLCDNIACWCVIRLSVDTQARVSRWWVHSMVATWWCSHCVWSNANYVTTVRRRELNNTFR